MSLPREPRQKMINMMYLVLTALLALNVSAEILNAFKTVNKSLEITNVTVNNSSETIMKSLEDKMLDPATAARAKKWYPKAKQVQDYSKTAYAFIQVIKDDIIKQGGGDPDKTSFKADNLDIATRLMIDGGKAKELQAQLETFKKNVLGVDPSIDSAFANTLPINTAVPTTVSKANRTFARAYFHMVPTVAALTILSKFQNDIKTSENKIVQFLHSKVGEVAVRFDTYNAFAATNKSYIMPGDEMEVMAGVGAFSKAALPQITIDGSPESLTEDGAAHRKMRASDALGKHTISVIIKYKDLDGADQVTKKDIEYIVGQSAASIALDKMNVMYIGVDNPVTISATGGGAEKLQVSITGGGGSLINKGDGAYIARVNSVTDECWINVSVDNRPAGKSKFRVRTIPMPIATVGGVASNENIPAGQFKAQQGVGAYIKDFPFELKYTVTGFTLVSDNDDGDLEEAICTGNMWSDKAANIVKNLKAGRTVSIENIRAMGPDGRNQKLPGLTYYIK
jgi:gliding motility-associated protein GldM